MLERKGVAGNNRCKCACLKKSPVGDSANLLPPCDQTLQLLANQKLHSAQHSFVLPCAFEFASVLLPGVCRGALHLNCLERGFVAFYCDCFRLCVNGALIAVMCSKIVPTPPCKTHSCTASWRGKG